MKPINTYQDFMERLFELDYQDLLQRILLKGNWVENHRTGARCLTVIGQQFRYNVGEGIFPILTTRKINWKMAIAEMIGYIRGYTSAADFRKVGAKTWDANANKNEAWLNNPARKGQDDMGKVYGAVGNQWQDRQSGAGLLSFSDIMKALIARKDDRGLIWSFWEPSSFSQGCLRPCMYEHQFSIVGDKLYLNSNQRSCDVPLGLAANMIQCYFLLFVAAKISGLQPAVATHNIVNAHIYENQIEGVKTLLERDLYEAPTFRLKEGVVLTLDYVLNEMTVEDFELENYQYHPVVKFPFTV